MSRTTILSPDRVYRYTLWREWDMTNPAYLNVIGLNPSTADETEDDPTIRKCIGFAKRLGYGALCMTNLFAFRATDPQMMLAHPAPIGPDNVMHLEQCARQAGLVIAAWGCDGHHGNQDRNVQWLLAESIPPVALHCLKRNKDGSPGHPLYLPYTAKPLIYTP